MIVIKPVGGLCNYLRVVFSYYKKACYENKKLIVIWEPTYICPGYFLDYFKPIDNIIFYTHNLYNYAIDYTGHGILENFEPNYEKLKLLDEIEIIINNKREILGNYIATHIRRTDHTNMAKKNNQFTDDDSFYNFIDKYIENKNLYIATDNEVTFSMFKNRYNDLIKIDYHNIINHFRKTSLKDAIIDLFMCVYADNFMGSGYSSFSILINTLRQEIEEKI